MLRVLARGCRLAVAVWDSLDNTPAYAAEVALVQRVAGQHAADALRAPFALGDRRQLSALFASAAVPSFAVTIHSGIARFPSVRSMVEADILGWLPLVGIALSQDQIDRVLQEARRSSALM